MFMRVATCVALLAVLGGCVTETISGKAPVEERPKEAADYNVQLGVGYLRQGDLESAQTKLEKAIELDSGNITAYRSLGIVYERLGDREGADRMYRRAVSLAPHDPDALNSQAVFLCRRGETRDQALRIFDEAIAVPQSKKFSNKAMLNTNAGVCVKGEDLERAENYLRTALAFDANFAEALLQMADVAYRRENYLQARAFLQRYVNVAEVSPSVLWLGRRVETALGDARAADDFGLRLRREFPESVEARRLLESQRNDG